MTELPRSPVEVGHHQRDRGADITQDKGPRARGQRTRRPGLAHRTRARPEARPPLAQNSRAS